MRIKYDSFEMSPSVFTLTNESVTQEDGCYFLVYITIGLALGPLLNPHVVGCLMLLDDCYPLDIHVDVPCLQ